jgi:hypothetical protein
LALRPDAEAGAGREQGAGDQQRRDGCAARGQPVLGASPSITWMVSTGQVRSATFG